MTSSASVGGAEEWEDARSGAPHAQSTILKFGSPAQDLDLLISSGMCSYPTGPHPRRPPASGMTCSSGSGLTPPA
jgi:hypothetical protein